MDGPSGDLTQSSTAAAVKAVGEGVEVWRGWGSGGGGWASTEDVSGEALCHSLTADGKRECNLTSS